MLLKMYSFIRSLTHSLTCSLTPCNHSHEFLHHNCLIWSEILWWIASSNNDLDTHFWASNVIMFSTKIFILGPSFFDSKHAVKKDGIMDRYVPLISVIIHVIQFRQIGTCNVRKGFPFFWRQVKPFSEQVSGSDFVPVVADVTNMHPTTQTINYSQDTGESLSAVTGGPSWMELLRVIQTILSSHLLKNPLQSSM